MGFARVLTAFVMAFWVTIPLGAARADQAALVNRDAPTGFVRASEPTSLMTPRRATIKETDDYARRAGSARNAWVMRSTGGSTRRDEGTQTSAPRDKDTQTSD